MKDLIKALTILSKYTDDEYVTQCEHDILYVCVDPAGVSKEDLKTLDGLGFRPNDVDGFSSNRFGSC